MRFKKTKKGFIDIQDISDFNPRFKYQVVVFKSDNTANPIVKKAKNKTVSVKIAREMSKKYL